MTSSSLKESVLPINTASTSAHVADASRIRGEYLYGRIFGNKCGHKASSFDEIINRGGELLALIDESIALGLFDEATATTTRQRVQQYVSIKQQERELIGAPTNGASVQSAEAEVEVEGSDGEEVS